VKRAHIWTIGCQMNDDDSEQMARHLGAMGYELVDDCVQADLVILNTCAVRARPEHKVMSKLGELREMKLARPQMVIGVAGCMAQREGERLGKLAPYVDFVIGPRQVSRLPEILQAAESSAGTAYALDDAAVPRRVAPHQAPLRAYVPVTYGCDNYCAYCVVPYVRGRETSRSASEIVAEVRDLVDRGTREVTLLGQNVNSYGRTLDTPVTFGSLLASLAGIRGLDRIRFMTSHPKDLSAELIDAVADLRPVCEHIHLPMQSGDDTVLRAMNRRYTHEHYFGLIEQIRARIPDCAITTDLIVGFPGESEAQYLNTLDVVRRVRFDHAFMFAYSERAGTAAAKLRDDVPKPEKLRRLNELIRIQNEITIEKNTADIGREHEVLVEGPSPLDPSRATGMTRRRRHMHFGADGGSLVGERVMVRAKEAFIWGYIGVLCSGVRAEAH
jgi:tRNA-2-methylthio-N6-dimethylallyladenosine synthase